MQPSKITCGVIGNPIKHSLSPSIHSNFAKQCNLNLDYQKYQLDEAQLKPFILDFFSNGGVGLNVTLPFKQQVLTIVDELTPAAEICQSVNTLSVNSDGKILGDTTDGDGFILDLNRLGYDYKSKNILVVGAGGASTSVIYGLLKNGAKVTLYNRTQSKVETIISQFESVGEIKPHSSNADFIADDLYDGLVCTISEFNEEMLKPLLIKLNNDAFIYDLNYAERSEKTLNYFEHNGFIKSSDGYGMLVGQAAKSFEIWHGVMPTIKI